uniref:PWWP domain-containing protein n=1 Tax=Knipowitschia caucasica TaxID=637954 RepID=A0AAV2JQR2_KNICA
MEASHLIEGKLTPLFRIKRTTTATLPAHLQAVNNRTQEEKRLVDCIVTSKETERHLMDILKRKQSEWYSLKPRFQVPVYLDTEEHQDTLFVYLRTLIKSTQTVLKVNNEVEFLLGFLFPEAIIHGICQLKNIPWKEAKEAYL